MKRIHFITTLFTALAVMFFTAVPTQAAANSILGSIDVFDGSQIHGWVYDTASQSAPEVLLKVTNTATGETVQEVSVTPNFARNDLSARLGTDTAAGFAASIDLSDVSDGVYAAAAYKDGQKITEDLYYTKTAPVSADGLSLKSLGNFRLTAYCPCYSCSEGWGRHTSSGALAVSNHTVAVDRRVIPIGSRLMINGTVYTAEDVGGGVRGNHIDIFFDSHAQTRQFGSQTAEVYLVQ